METKTLVIAAAVMIAATAAMAIAPLLASSAMAIRNGEQQFTDTCVHNGNGRTTEGACSGNGNSANTVTTCTQKVRGQFVAC
jgi:hypothetical protein